MLGNVEHSTNRKGIDSLGFEFCSWLKDCAWKFRTVNAVRIVLGLKTKCTKFAILLKRINDTLSIHVVLVLRVLLHLEGSQLYIAELRVLLRE